MRYQVELSHVKWKKCMQMQMAMHCAPVLAGLKPSNAVTLDYIDSNVSGCCIVNSKLTSI